MLGWKWEMRGWNQTKDDFAEGGEAGATPGWAAPPFTWRI